MSVVEKRPSARLDIKIIKFYIASSLGAFFYFGLC